METRPTTQFTHAAKFLVPATILGVVLAMANTRASNTPLYATFWISTLPFILAILTGVAKTTTA